MNDFRLDGMLGLGSKADPYPPGSGTELPRLSLVDFVYLVGD